MKKLIDILLLPFYFIAVFIAGTIEAHEDEEKDYYEKYGKLPK